MSLFHSSALQDYIHKFGARETKILQELRVQTATMPESSMQIDADAGQALSFLVRLLKPSRILEIGTYTGYSSLCMALASPPDTQIFACDKNPEWTKIARKYWAMAGVEHKIELHLGRALKTLDEFSQKCARFDFIFIDADKSNYGNYFEICLSLLNPNGIICIDNTLWGGDVADETIQDEACKTIRALNARIQGDTTLDFVLLPLSDGLTLVRKLEE